MTTRVRSSHRLAAIGIVLGMAMGSSLAAPAAAVPSVAALPAADLDSATITVATYNIHKSSSGKPTWTDRRQAVADTILAQAPDVIALEEATPNRIDGVRQYDDILGLIDDQLPYRFAAAGDYTSGTKLAYNSARLSVAAQGSKILKKLGSQRRYAVWAILTDRTNGNKYFVVATHLEPGSATKKRNKVRIKQAKQILALVKDKNAGYPVVILGDMNSSRSTKPYNGQYLAFTRGGMLDPLDNPKACAASGENALAQTLVDVNYNSANKWRTVAPKAPSTWLVGTNVDYIYVSAGVTVPTFRTVVDVNLDGTFVGGQAPSDHNMLVATIGS